MLLKLIALCKGNLFQINTTITNITRQGNRQLMTHTTKNIPKGNRQFTTSTTKNVPKITLYEHVDFKGRSKTYSESNANLLHDGFDDKASSVIVEDGVWVLYQKANFHGNICVLMQGDRINLVKGTPADKSTMVNEFNKAASSLKPLNFDLNKKPDITVFEGDFNSRSERFTDDVSDLRWYKMNDCISYIRVHSGGWIGYEAVDYCGIQTLYLPGEYKMSCSDGHFKNDALSSLRAIKYSFPLVLEDIQYDLPNVSMGEELVSVFSWEQTNDTNVEQKLSLTENTTIQYENSHEFKWNSNTAITAQYSFKVGAPLISKSKVKIGIATEFNVGQKNRKTTTTTEALAISVPSVLPPRTTIHVESSMTKGKINVPFTAKFSQGDRKWEEKGNFIGVQHYGLNTNFHQK